MFKTYYSVIHIFLWPSHIFGESIKSFIYILTGVTFPFILKFIYTRRFFRKILLKLDHRTINKNIFDDVIDYNKKTMVKVYVKNSNNFYLGNFSLIGENGKNYYISLINYALLEKDTCKLIYKQDTSSIVFNFNDIEKIEFIYENDSEVWKTLNQ